MKNFMKYVCILLGLLAQPIKANDLHVLIKKQDSRLVRFFLTAKIEEANKAFAEKKMGKAKELLEKYLELINEEIDYKDQKTGYVYSGVTPLMLTILLQHWGCFMLLLTAYGIDVNKGIHEVGIPMQIEENKDSILPTGASFSPLHVALILNLKTFVSALLETHKNNIDACVKSDGYFAISKENKVAVVSENPAELAQKYCNECFPKISYIANDQNNSRIQKKGSPKKQPKTINNNV